MEFRSGETQRKGLEKIRRLPSAAYVSEIADVASGVTVPRSNDGAFQDHPRPDVFIISDLAE